MVRIGGGVFPDIKEKDYLAQGNYRVDDQAPPVTAASSATLPQLCVTKHIDLRTGKLALR